jgi:hypothetical protein
MIGSNIQVNEDIIEKARSDDGNSLFAIGDLYYNQKTMISFWKAMAWYRRSAKMDNSDAQNMIGYFYQHGLGIPVNYSQAKEWYQNAANQGNMKAQNNLGFIFDEGLGVSIDSTQALYWYQKAAAQGYSFAQYNLGMMFESGQRVETNKRIALEWYKKSAINGDLDAADKVEELEYQFYLEGLVTENKGMYEKFDFIKIK